MSNIAPGMKSLEKFKNSEEIMIDEIKIKIKNWIKFLQKKHSLNKVILILFSISIIVNVELLSNFKYKKSKIKGEITEYKYSDYINNVNKYFSDFSKINIVNNISKKENYDDGIKYNNSKHKNYYTAINDKSRCFELDPINLEIKRLATKPTIICKSKYSEHICFKNQNNLYFIREGLTCKIKNVILDKNNWKESNLIYKGPIDKSGNDGFPLLSKGFFNMKCDNINNVKHYNDLYNRYLNAWNYNENFPVENIEELAPNKIVFLFSRNQDSPNLFHGISELLNAFIIMRLLNIKSSNVQVLFLDSMVFKNDPLYYLYKTVISNGTEPLFIRNLTKRYYKISSGINIPYIWDSPCFTHLRIPFPKCKNKTKTYKYFYDEIAKYIEEFQDSFNYDNETFYYPNIYKTKNLNNYNKFITIQWRKIWPKGRTGQFRILGNGPELAEKLSKYLPSNILLRLVDTANLTFKQQISLMKKTNYLVGVHGAGLTLSIFLPENSIIQEIKNSTSVIDDHLIMSALAGHKVYSDYIKSEKRVIDGNEILFFSPEEFKEKVLEHLNINNSFNK